VVSYHTHNTLAARSLLINTPRDAKKRCPQTGVSYQEM